MIVRVAGRVLNSDVCGLVEWYVPDLSGIVADGETVRELDGSAPDPGDPYR